MTLYMLGTDTALRLIGGRTPSLDGRVAATVSGELCISALTRGELLCGLHEARPTDPWDREMHASRLGWLASLMATDPETLRQQGRALLDTLTPSEALQLRRRFALDRPKARTLEEISAQFERTRQRLRDSGNERLSLLIEYFLSRLTCLPWDASAATHFAAVTAQLEAAGIDSHPIDRMVAGHAIAADAIFVSARAETFAGVSGLRVEDWTDIH